MDLTKKLANTKIEDFWFCDNGRLFVFNGKVSIFKILEEIGEEPAIIEDEDDYVGKDIDDFYAHLDFAEYGHLRNMNYYINGKRTKVEGVE